VGLKFKSTLLTLEIHDLHYISSDQKIANLLDHKNKRLLNFNNLSPKTNYSKNGAEKAERTCDTHEYSYL
jgi:hypothetical protein